MQRWMNACGGRGNYPIKFNGSIFTVDPKYTGKPESYSPDWREWGDRYWWQNTRLPYQPLPACGDFDLMRPLFRFYREGRAVVYGPCEDLPPGCRPLLPGNDDGLRYLQATATTAGIGDTLSRKT